LGEKEFIESGEKDGRETGEERYDDTSTAAADGSRGRKMLVEGMKDGGEGW